MGIEEIFKSGAAARGINADNYRNEIAAVIDICYNNSDPVIRTRLNWIFEKKPTPEQFVLGLAAHILKQNEKDLM